MVELTILQVQTFAEKLSKWMPLLKHKEKADILGIPLDTFRGWLYGKHLPTDFVRQEVDRLMEEEGYG